MTFELVTADQLSIVDVKIWCQFLSRSVTADFPMAHTSVSAANPISYARSILSFLIGPFNLVDLVFSDVVCRVEEHQHQLGRRCSPCEKFAHT